MPKNVQTTAQLYSFHTLGKKVKSLSCVWLFATPWTVASTIHGILHARILEWVAISFSKVVLKILQVRLQQYVNHELPDVQSGFR